MTSTALQEFKELAQLAQIATRGMGQFLHHGEGNAECWRAFLDLHCRTNGRSTQMLRGIMRVLKPPPVRIRPFESMLGKFDAASVNAITERIRRDGYYLFEQRVPDDVCDDIAGAARAIEGRVGRNPEEPLRMAAFDPANPIANVYDIPEPTIWQIPGYQRLIADPIFLNVSQSYFCAASALKQVNLWWSAAVGGKPDTHAAQLFHFDFDAAPIWLKFFFYLTDVTPQTGPHVFVKGSHRLHQPKARELLSRGYVRIRDEDIAQVYGLDNILEFCGPKGTVLAVDTIGFHKGKMPTAGYRLLAQLEYATPLFVPSVSAPLPMPSNVDRSLLSTYKTYPWAFTRFAPRGLAETPAMGTVITG
jgi:hypothetical protein